MALQECGRAVSEMGRTMSGIPDTSALRLSGIVRIRATVISSSPAVRSILMCLFRGEERGARTGPSSAQAHVSAQRDMSGSDAGGTASDPHTASPRGSRIPSHEHPQSREGGPAFRERHERGVERRSGRSLDPFAVPLTVLHLGAVTMRARVPCQTSDGSPMRSRSTCQRRVGSESRSQSRPATGTPSHSPRSRISARTISRSSSSNGSIS